MIMISGLLYMFYNTLGDHLKFIDKISLESIALWHTLGAFLMISFLVTHIYMTTTGHSPLSNIKAMLTGYEEIEQEKQLKENSK